MSTVVKAVGERRHYRALAGMCVTYPNPARELAYYLSRGGRYPRTLSLRTPLGTQTVTLDAPDDFLTVNEIFCRRDYETPPDTRVVVDFGSNIGISALYFLSRSRQMRIFCFEPVPRNTRRLRANLSPFADRYTLQEICIGISNGDVEFGVEPTGRYGGIGIATGQTARFPMRDVNDCLAEILSQPGIKRIDILKTDIEGYDVPVLQHIRPEFLNCIDRIYAELPHGFPLTDFRCTQRGMIARWTREAE